MLQTYSFSLVEEKIFFFSRFGSSVTVTFHVRPVSSVASALALRFRKIEKKKITEECEKMEEGKTERKTDTSSAGRYFKFSFVKWQHG